MRPDLALKAAKLTRDPDRRDDYLLQFRAAKLREKIIDCDQCDLKITSRQRVPWSGKVPAQVAVVGEAPGADEDKRGEPFVGRAGRLLKKGLVTVGFDHRQIVYLNTICCRPPKNNYDFARRVGAPQACNHWFEKQLEISGAWLVIVAGNTALDTTLGMVGITAYRGKPVWRHGRIWVPIKHPAWYLRSRDKIQELYTDLALVKRLQDGYEAIPFKARAEEWGKLKEMPRHDIKKIMDGNGGWILVYSHVLQEQVVVVKHEDIVVPEPATGLIRYTMQEMARMRELGMGKRLPREQLRIIHNLKKELGVTYVSEHIA